MSGTPGQSQRETASDATRSTGLAPSGAGEQAARASLEDLLTAQCLAGPAKGGAVLRVRPVAQPPETADTAQAAEIDARVQVLALRPALRAGQSPPYWLRRAADELARTAPEAAPVRVTPLDAEQGSLGEFASSLVLIDLSVRAIDGGAERTSQAFLVQEPRDDMALVVHRLRLTAGLIEAARLREERDATGAALDRAREVLAHASAALKEPRFHGAALALCNRACAWLGASRATLGVLRGRAVHALAISHTDKFSRRSALVQDLEAAMEECLDQDTEVTLPDDPEAGVVTRAARQFSLRHGPCAMCAVPLRWAEGREGRELPEPVAVLLVERAPDHPFTPGEVEGLRLLCDLVSGPLVRLRERDLWPGAKAALSARRALAWALGTRHTWAKAAALGLLALVLAMALIKGVDRVPAGVRIEASELRIIAAPFDGYLLEAAVKAGDEVAQPGAVLARLDDSALRLELSQAQADLTGAERAVALAQRERDEAKVQLSRAEADKARARIELLEDHIARATLSSPIAGRVVKGDLSRAIGGPVRAGDVLLEIAPLSALRAEVFIDEGRIGDVREGATGELLVAAYPGRPLRIAIERIDPVAQVRDGQNVFRAIARLESAPDWLRPGMEGSARLDAGRKPLGAIWLRDAVNWVRLNLWI